MGFGVQLGRGRFLSGLVIDILRGPLCHQVHYVHISDTYVLVKDV